MYVEVIGRTGLENMKLTTKKVNDKRKESSCEESQECVGWKEGGNRRWNDTHIEDKV